MLKLNSMQQDAAGSDVKATSISKSGKKKVIVRGGDKPDSKDLFFEVWLEDSGKIAQGIFTLQARPALNNSS